jgi:hypothetical protein
MLALLYLLLHEVVLFAQILDHGVLLFELLIEVGHLFGDQQLCAF